MNSQQHQFLYNADVNHRGARSAVSEFVESTRELGLRSACRAVSEG
jgi:hypothetical protein